jgi:hypothetical protein
MAVVLGGEALARHVAAFDDAEGDDWPDRDDHVRCERRLAALLLGVAGEEACCLPVSPPRCTPPRDTLLVRALKPYFRLAFACLGRPWHPKTQGGPLSEAA